MKKSIFANGSLYGGIIASVVLFMVFGCTAQEAASTDDNASVPLPGTVSVPMSEITESIKHYTFDAGSVSVKYFAVKGSDDVIHTAFDACEVCFLSGKGYSQVGTDVMCNNCGLRFRIDDLGTKNQGKGCWPAYLPHEIQEDNMVIKKSDLGAGSYLFGG